MKYFLPKSNLINETTNKSRSYVLSCSIMTPDGVMNCLLCIGVMVFNELRTTDKMELEDSLKYNGIISILNRILGVMFSPDDKDSNWSFSREGGTIYKVESLHKGGAESRLQFLSCNIMMMRRTWLQWNEYYNERRKS